jgi:cell division protein FtsB
MCSKRVEIAKKQKRLRGLRNEISKIGKKLCRITDKDNFDLEEVQNTTAKLHDLTEEVDKLEAEITLLESNQEPALSPA